MGTMTGNPKDSPWRSTSNERRHRKRFEITLSDEARAKLEELVEVRGSESRSEVIEELILEAKK